MSYGQHIVRKESRDDEAKFAYGLSKKLGSQAEATEYLVSMYRCGRTAAWRLIKRGERLAAGAAEGHEGRMTSRREFFGLLAAAPLVVPAMAKELAATSPGAALTIGKDIPIWVEGRALMGCRIIEGPLISGNEINLFLRKHWRFASPPDPPNRLYGSQINAEGEAV